MAQLQDGYQTLVTFANLPGLSVIFHEREVQPPSVEAGEIDTMTMRDMLWRGKWPKSLLSAGDVTIPGRYDPVAYTTIVARIGRPANVTTCVIRMPDLSTLTLYGWIDSITPPSHKEGEMPLMEIKFKVSNRNGGYAEVGPAYAAA